MPLKGNEMTKDNGLASRLAWCYSAICRGLLYPGSEGDSPYLPFHAPYDGRDLTAEAFRQAAGLANWWEFNLRPARDWFRELGDPGLSGVSEDEASAYQHLRRAMEATLNASPLHIKTWSSGAEFRATRHYIVGVVENGDLAGLHVHSIET